MEIHQKKKKKEKLKIGELGWVDGFNSKSLSSSLSLSLHFLSHGVAWIEKFIFPRKDYGIENKEISEDYIL